ncbi:unnamed protein product [Owenia fusiformis]|uniref:Uncharacterized protein n=1 Tax=Owenia fusiformis TaxID=6347 RepID=A0A8J1XQ29_OWEFU|nr:unnamed protein product [Owenia fusiformis]
MWKLNVAVASIMLVLLVYSFIINSKGYQHIRETNIRFKFSKQKDTLSHIVNEDGEQMITPLNELAMPLLTSGDARKSRKQSLLFSHFPKAGGSEIRHILTTVVGESINVDQNRGMYKNNSTILEDNYFLQTEFVSLEPYQKSNFFVIAHVRSPCNYLLSLWAFGSDGKGALYHSTRDKSVYGNTPPYNNKDDLKRFTMWLQDNKKIYTNRLVHKYFNNNI